MWRASRKPRTAYPIECRITTLAAAVETGSAIAAGISNLPSKCPHEPRSPAASRVESAAKRTLIAYAASSLLSWACGRAVSFRLIKAPDCEAALTLSSFGGGVSSRPANRLLAALPLDDFRRIQPHLTTVPVSTRQVFHKRGEPIRAVYFLNGGMASVTVAMSDGTMVEVATVGDEGVLGVGAVFGSRASSAETMVQVPDTDAEMMPMDAFSAELSLRSGLHECVGRYAEGFLALVMQSTACMALHEVQERCARWLLMAHDRVRRDEFELSQEFLAMMLGSSRPTVTVAAGVLQQAGLIRYRYGRISVEDRAGLERAACECYAHVKEQYDQLGL